MMKPSDRQSAFKVGGRIEDPYFIDRHDAQDVLLRDARTLSQSHVVMAPRRFGKTALLRRICAELSGEMLAPYVNCLPLHRPDVFHDRIVEAVLDAFETRHGRARRLLATWKDVLTRPVIGALQRLEEVGGSVQSVGSVRLKFRTQEADADELLRAALDFPERFAEEQGESILLALDELQALAALGDGIFSLFKASMDSQQRVVYLFSGSSLTLLSDVFAREGESPLYQMVGRIFLGELDPALVADFVRRRLKTVHDVDMTSGALSRFLELVGGIPYYVQKLGLLLEHRLHVLGARTLQDADVDSAFDALLNELDLDFQERWTTRFSGQQQAILLALCQGAATSGGIAQRAATAPENLTYNLKKLLGTRILSKDEGRYRITDRVFAAWLAHM
jgi:AAA+ ATPase superfamily predicted ATPase